MHDVLVILLLFIFFPYTVHSAEVEFTISADNMDDSSDNSVTSFNGNAILESKDIYFKADRIEVYKYQNKDQVLHYLLYGSPVYFSCKKVTCLLEGWAEKIEFYHLENEYIFVKGIIKQGTQETRGERIIVKIINGVPAIEKINNHLPLGTGEAIFMQKLNDQFSK